MKEKFCSLFRFSGRVSRMCFFLGAVILPLVILIVIGLLGNVGDMINAIENPILAYTAAILFLAVVFGLLIAAFVIALSFHVRRFHDMNHSGWWVLLSGLLWIALLFWRGTLGENSYGKDPLQLP